MKISPRKGIFLLGNKRKLAPRFVGPFHVIERIGSIMYKLALPQQLSHVHHVFHVSKLKKRTLDPTWVIALQEVQSDEDTSYSEKPLQIL